MCLTGPNMQAWHLHQRLRLHNKHAGTYKLEYLPYRKGIYEVSVRVGGVHISGSPFSAEVLDSQEQGAFYASRKYTTVEGSGRAMMTVGVLNSFIGKRACTEPICAQMFSMQTVCPSIVLSSYIHKITRACLQSSHATIFSSRCQTAAANMP
jgi:hypothetical protein